jgi:IclR family pca regulon transcriptional regulator
MTVAINVGTRFPAHATSMGRVLLAGLSPEALDDYIARADLRAITPKTIHDAAKLRAVLTRVRSQGFALVDQELEVGLRSIAVPIHDGDGTVVAAMNVSMHVGRGSADAARRELLPHLRTTAAAIDGDLAASHPARASARRQF